MKEKHALLDKMGERTKELKALMACGGEDTHPSPESAAPREKQATANSVCAETCRLVCTESSKEDLGDCDDIGFAGVVIECLDNLSEGTLGEALTTHVVAPPIDTGDHTHTSKREPIEARYTNTATGSMKEGSKREPTAARYINTATGSTKKGDNEPSSAGDGSTGMSLITAQVEGAVAMLAQQLGLMLTSELASMMEEMDAEGEMAEADACPAEQEGGFMAKDLSLIHI